MKTVTPKQFTKLLTDFRKRNGWSQRDACTALGLNLRTLQNWEQGRNLPTGYALASLLKLIQPANP